MEHENMTVRLLDEKWVSAVEKKAKIVSARIRGLIACLEVQLSPRPVGSSLVHLSYILWWISMRPLYSLDMRWKVLDSRMTFTGGPPPMVRRVAWDIAFKVALCLVEFTMMLQSAATAL